MIYFLIIFFIGCLILFGIDFYFFIVNRYCRFHIGRWNNDKQWENTVIKKGLSWVKKTPTVKKTDNSRYVLFDMIHGEYRSQTIQSWQKGALILGLQNINDKKSKESIETALNHLIDSTGNFKNNPVAVDCGLLSYAILKNSNPEKVKPAMDYAKNIIMNNIGKDEMIAYVNNPNSDERYVDTIGLTCPFLAYYGKVYNQPQIAKEAVKQLKLFSQYGLEQKSLLPNHAFSTQSKLPLGVYGWGRGVAWYIIGLIDSYFEIECEEDKKWLTEQIKAVADKYKIYQREDGGFGYIFQMQNGYDSSATAVMAYFYKRCFEIFKDEEYMGISKKCLRKLKSVTRITGAIDWCQGDTKGIGIFAQTFDIMPFAQGFCMRSFMEEDK